ncbi:CxxxxCH/CxxCH domain c-type cytochrome [Geomobilimonas luticola]|uniref:CxxxxCH/CxxCH domain-containing protein n=1 Tax=Geomobilimonas luticola TaxID=1114878 RepID=A0ABS5S9I8_9BACT|nr:CxxxxCH/CxxCH domain-containing protein [Geomobilimonas luticola]MBT0652041.1 CxxxxCH/CxxCH domain-containing protein [Geomobilimonas luticola]
MGKFIQTRPVLTLALLVSISMGQGLFRPVESLASGTITTCSGCHENPPVDGTARNTPAGRFQGSHTTHTGTAAGQYGFLCTRCHANNGTNYAHADGIIQINSPLNGEGAGRVYSRTNPPAANTFTPGTCSTYCHSDGKATPTTYATPTWGTAASGNCGTCHRVQNTLANMQAAGSPSALSSAHYEHLATDRYGLNAAYNCGACHAETASDNTTLIVAGAGSKHVNSARDWKFGTFAGLNQSGGTYTTSCSSTYCHSKGRSTTAPFTAPMTSITWASGYNSATCVTCHGGNDTTANVTANGPFDSHVDHIATDQYNFKCDECHAETVANDSSTTINATTGYTKHVNGAKDYKFSATIKATAISQATGTYTTGTCANLYCHSMGTRRTADPTTYPYTGAGIAPVTAPGWTATLACNGCHGDSGSTTGRPSYTNGTPKANSHVAHGSLTCEKCHYTTTATGTTIAATGFASHVDTTYDVNNQAGTITYTAGTVAATGIPAGGTCAGTFGCHGGATWGGASMSCVSCHNAPLGNRRQVTATGTAPDGTGGTTGGDFIRASRHVSNGTTTQIVKQWDCIVCHLEGDTATGKTSGQHAGTPNSNADVNLRNVDNYTTGWIWNRLTIGGLSAANQQIMRNDMDRFCVSCHDSDTSSNNTVVLLTNAAGSNTTNWNFTGVTNYYAVSDNDADTTYDRTTTAAATMTVNMDDLSKWKGMTWNITSVTVKALVRSEATTATAKLALKSGATTYKSASAVAINTTYATISNTWATNPNGNVAWTVDAINALEAGVEATTISTATRVTQVWIELDVTNTNRDIGAGSNKLTWGPNKGGASTIAVNATNNGMLTSTPGTKVARAMTPFNTSDTQQNAKEASVALKTYRNGRGVTDVRGAFNYQGLRGKSWASHHNLSIFQKRYSSAGTYIGSGGWNAINTKDGQALQTAQETTSLHCSDCHLNEVNAHGSQNSFYMLQNSSGNDAAFTNIASTSTTDNCARCHAAAAYNAASTSGHSNAHNDACSSGWLATKGIASMGSTTNVVFAETGTTELFCVGCHGGYQLGGIHGVNNFYNPYKQAGWKSRTYRFMGTGGSMRWYSPISNNLPATADPDVEWEQMDQSIGCYTISSTDAVTFGACDHHNAGRSTTTKAPNNARPLTY